MITRRMVTVWLIVWTVLAVWMCRITVVGAGNGSAFRLNRWTGNLSFVAAEVISPCYWEGNK